MYKWSPVHADLCYRLRIHITLQTFLNLPFYTMRENLFYL